LVSGAVNQAFIPNSNGEFAVIVTQNFCSDTSDCINFTTAGFDNFIAQELQISPNPAQESFQIGLPFWALNAELVVFDVTGKEVDVLKPPAPPPPPAPAAKAHPLPAPPPPPPATTKTSTLG
jgi:hypothetical protein